jgi:hypothetical protein
MNWLNKQGARRMEPDRDRLSDFCVFNIEQKEESADGSSFVSDEKMAQIV